MDTIKYSKAVAKNVESAIKACGFTWVEAADRTGIPRTTLMRHINSPEFSPFNIAELHKVAVIAKTSVADLTNVRRPIKRPKKENT